MRLLRTRTVAALAATATAGALAIAIGTIAGHAIKVARSNPINALRYE